MVAMFVRVAPEHEQMETGPSKNREVPTRVGSALWFRVFPWAGLGWQAPAGLAGLRRMTISSRAIGTPTWPNLGSRGRARPGQQQRHPQALLWMTGRPAGRLAGPAGNSSCVCHGSPPCARGCRGLGRAGRSDSHGARACLCVLSASLCRCRPTPLAAGEMGREGAIPRQRQLVSQIQGSSTTSRPIGNAVPGC